MVPKVALKNKTLDFSQRAYVMGVLNLTPDSFSDGSKFLQPQAAIEHALRMEAQGADIIDVGGESTRPGAPAVPPEEELRRVLPVLERLSGRLQVPISIDTRKSQVAEKCIEVGAEIVNDISGLGFDPRMKEIVARHDAPVVIMHIKGDPESMQDDPRYDDLIGEIYSYFEKRIAAAVAAGVSPHKIILDPGIGFGKTLSHNLEILKRLENFQALGKPIMVGPSRKSFLGRILNLPVEERLEGSIAASIYAVLKGANIVRVHDVGATTRALKIVEAIQKAA